VFPSSDIESLEFRQGQFANQSLDSGGAAQIGIVGEHNPLISAKKDIELDGISTLFPGEFDRGKGVFGSIVRGTAMRDDFDTPRNGQRSYRHE
jgi:hypothetical protein